MLLLLTLKGPEFVEGLLLKEHNFSLVVEACEPSLRIRCYIVIALTMAKDLSLLIPTNSNRRHDTALM